MPIIREGINGVVNKTVQESISKGTDLRFLGMSFDSGGELITKAAYTSDLVQWILVLASAILLARREKEANQGMDPTESGS